MANFEYVGGTPVAESQSWIAKNIENIGNVIVALVFLAFCVAIIYAVFQIGRYFAKRADKQG